MPMLKFDEATHTYTLDGKVLPSVTTILRPLQDFSGIPAEVLERKRQIGTAVHKAIELDLEEALDESSLSEAVRPYFAAWLRFKAEFQLIPLWAETQVYAQAGYAGTVDLICGRGTQRWVIDYKTSAQVGPVAALQTAAYAHAAHERGLVNHGPKRAALHLREDGTYRLIEHKDRGDLQTFLALLTIFNWRTTYGC